MDIRINLLPPSDRSHSSPVLAKVLTMFTLGILLLLSGLYGYGFYTGWQLERQLSDARNQYELLRPTREKMKQANELQQQITAKNNVLIRLTNERKSWYAVLTHLGTMTPGDVWFTELTAAEKNTLRLKGMAGDYQAVARFLQTFNKDEVFSEPVLISADQDSAQPVSHFEMIAKVKGL